MNLNNVMVTVFRPYYDSWGRQHIEETLVFNASTVHRTHLAEGKTTDWSDRHMFGRNRRSGKSGTSWEQKAANLMERHEVFYTCACCSQHFSRPAPHTNPKHGGECTAYQGAHWWYGPSFVSAYLGKPAPSPVLSDDKIIPNTKYDPATRTSDKVAA